MAFWRRRSSDPFVYPAISSFARIYAVGDIHGCIIQLEATLAMIDLDCAFGTAEAADDVIEVYLGDYVDRGPDSRAVMDRLVERSAQHHTVFLAGNHEALMLEFLDGGLPAEAWCRVGGYQTLTSYGVSPDLVATAASDEVCEALRERLPSSHRALLDSTRDYWAVDGYVFVHAGLRPGVPLERQSRDDLLWIRDSFYRSDEDFGAVVVHGHTPVDEPEFARSRINIDTGAFATGRLTCLCIDGEGPRILTSTAGRNAL